MSEQAILSGNSSELKLPLTIRLAQQSDLAELEWFGLHTHYRKVMANTLNAQQRGTACMLIAEINHFPAGQLCVDFTRHERNQRATLWALRVFQPFRANGLGAALMAAGEARILSHGWREVELGVDRDNARVLPFYQRLGYQISGEERGHCYYRDHRDRLICEPVEQWILTRTLIAEEAPPVTALPLPAAITLPVAEPEPPERASGWSWLSRR